MKESYFLFTLKIVESNYLSNLLISLFTAKGSLCFKQITFQTKLKKSNNVVILPIECD